MLPTIVIVLVIYFAAMVVIGFMGRNKASNFEGYLSMGRSAGVLLLMGGAIGGNIGREAFGIVAMVAMTPLSAIQILGAVYQYKSRTAEAGAAVSAAYLDTWGDDDIIEL